MAKFKFVEWLLSWLIETEEFGFEWDSGNKTKNKNKHGVETFEIEQIFKSRLAIPLGVQISPEVDEERLAVVGPTLEGRLLHIVFTLRDGRVRPISGRPAHKTEKVQYGKILRKISQRI
jgi:uncharacterized DUF497 family protein